MTGLIVFLFVIVVVIVLGLNVYSATQKHQYYQNKCVELGFEYYEELAYSRDKVVCIKIIPTSEGTYKRVESNGFIIYGK